MGFTVYPYSRGTLRKLLSDSSISPEREVTDEYLAKYKSLHFTYFDDYFEQLGAKSVIVEFEYIDRDYLEDYAAYYVRCFQDFKKKCVRLHFLSVEVNTENFSSLLAAADYDSTLPNLLEDNYLGFIVVRPLPDALFGRSCLRTYPSDCENGDTRLFPVARKYDVSLFGLQQSVNTLAFQEQDTVAAACASSALWSAFQATCRLYGHEALSPIEVTRRATRYYVGVKRPVPSKGLAPDEMIRAIRDIGLESHTYELLNPEIDDAAVKALIYGYARMGVPVILGIHLFDLTNTKYLGAHAVTVAGYRIAKQAPQSNDRSKFHSDRLVKIYVNDDHIGPFARMEFVAIPSKEKDILLQVLKDNRQYTGSDLVALSTNWGVEAGSTIVAIPFLAIIPVYHKIRIELLAVANCIQEFDTRILQWLSQHVPMDEVSANGYEWELFLDTIGGYRRDIRKRTDLASDVKLHLLTSPMPRFLWRAIALDGGKRALEFVFDATGIERGRLFIQAVKHDTALTSMIAAFSKHRDLIKQPFINPQVDWILDAFLRK